MAVRVAILRFMLQCSKALAANLNTQENHHDDPDDR